MANLFSWMRRRKPNGRATVVVRTGIRPAPTPLNLSDNHLNGVRHPLSLDPQSILPDPSIPPPPQIDIARIQTQSPGMNVFRIDQGPAQLHASSDSTNGRAPLTLPLELITKDPSNTIPSSPPPRIRVEEDVQTVISKLFPTEFRDGKQSPTDGNVLPAGTNFSDFSTSAQPENLSEFSSEFSPVKLGLSDKVTFVSMPNNRSKLQDSSMPLGTENDVCKTAKLTDDKALARRTRRSFLSSLLVIGHLLVLNVLSIPVTAYIIHKLGPTGYGMWNASLTLVTLTGLLTTLGLRPLFVKRVAQNPRYAQEELALQLGLRMILAFGACALCAAIGFALGYPATVLICIGISAVSMFMTAISNALVDLMQGLHQMKRYSAINFISGTTLTVISFIAVLMGAGPIGVSVAYMIGPAVSLGGAWMVINKSHFPIQFKFDFKRYQEMLRESRSVSAYQISVVIRDRMEHLMLPKLTGMTKFGFYSAGTMPADRLFIVPEGFITAFFPTISKSHHDDPNAVLKPILHLFITSVVACAPLAILVSYLAEPISRILFKTDPTLCRDVIRITIWAVPLRGLQLPMGSALQATGHHAVAARAGIFATVVSLAITVLLIIKFGVVGAYWSWVVRPAVSCAFLYPEFHRLFPRTFYRVPFVKIGIGVAAIYGVLAWFQNQSVATWPMRIGGSLAAVAIYAIILILLKVIDIGDVKLLLGRRTASEV